MSESNGWGVLSKGKYGILMSLTLQGIGIIFSIIAQRYAPTYLHMSSWYKGCPSDYQDSCFGESAVLRCSMALAIMFALQIFGTSLYSGFFDILWSVKFFIFFALIIGLWFPASSVFNLDGYAWLARVLGFFFVILEQVLLLDLAYSWNEKWLEYANADEDAECLWKTRLLAISSLFFACSVSAQGVMLWQFSGCTDSLVIMTLTIILSFIATITQIFISDVGSVLTSAIVAGYSTYVCYSAVTLNPNVSCNPTLQSGYQTLSTVIGLILTVISLLWTTYSSISTIPTVVDQNTGATFHASDIMGFKKKKSSNVPSDGNPAVSVAQPASAVDAEQGSQLVTTAAGQHSPQDIKALLVQTSLIFFLITGYYAMVLTNWATLQSSNSISSPKTGIQAMWIQAAAQWIAILMYIWSLVAPKILTDREF